MVMPRSNKQWEFPGSGVEIYERIAKTIVRECYEESGYTLRLTSDVPLFVDEGGFYSRGSKKFYHAIRLFYAAELAAGEQDEGAIQAHETEAVAWVPLATLDKANYRSIVYPVIELLRGKSNGSARQRRW
jgi:8-oxo-dGTP pyrophosphatase MutT (NUDIX family)